MNEHQWEQSESLILLCDVLHEVLTIAQFGYKGPDAFHKEDRTDSFAELHSKVSDVSIMIQRGRMIQGVYGPEDTIGEDK